MHLFQSIPSLYRKKTLKVPSQLHPNTDIYSKSILIHCYKTLHKTPIKLMLSLCLKNTLQMTQSYFSIIVSSRVHFYLSQLSVLIERHRCPCNLLNFYLTCRHIYAHLVFQCMQLSAHSAGLLTEMPRFAGAQTVFQVNILLSWCT